jgi:hypothetical protein
MNLKSELAASFLVLSARGSVVLKEGEEFGLLDGRSFA